MYWFLLLRIICFIVGLLLIFKTNSFRFSNWIIRHGLDEKGRRRRLIGLRILGVLIVALIILDFFRYYLIEIFYDLVFNVF